MRIKKITREMLIHVQQNVQVIFSQVKEMLINVLVIVLHHLNVLRV